MPLNRGWSNGLIDDDGSGHVGTIWNKSQVNQFEDVIDAALVPLEADHAVLPAALAARPIGPYPGSGVTVGNLVYWSQSLGQGINDSGIPMTDVQRKSENPHAHAATHLATGTDAIPNVSTGWNGMCPQLPGNTTTFLRGDGTWAVPPGGGAGGPHAATHAAGGGDTVDVKTLGGYPGGTTTFLRADGTFAAPAGGSGSGDVVGPGSAVDNAVARFDGVTGKLIQSSAATLSDAGSLLLTSAQPALVLLDTDQPANQKQVRILFDADKLSWQALNDAGGVLSTLLEANRSSGDVGVGFRDLYVTRNVIAAGLGTTPLDATNLTAGTLPDARLSANVIIKAASGQILMTPANNVGVLISGQAVPAGGYQLYVDSALAGWTGTLFHCGINNVPRLQVSSSGIATVGVIGTSGLQIGQASLLGYGTAADSIVFAANGYLYLGAGGAGEVRSLNVYNTTDSSTANVVISATGRLARSTSSRRYKTAIEPLTDWRWLLQLQPVTFEALSAPGTRRFGGLLAEDVAAHGPQAHGRPVFAGLDEQGRPDDVAYDHLHAPLIAAVQDLHARLQKLEAGA